MSVAASMPTDLLTPLGAYLRLRDAGGGAFLLESVERGRLGRYSFVGTGSRLCDLAEAEVCGKPVVGYVSYDHVAQLEPTVPLPPRVARFAESRFVVAETLLRFDHAQGVANVLAGDPGAIAAQLEGPVPTAGARHVTRPGELRRFPTRGEYQAQVVSAQDAIRAGEAFQIVLSQRAERPTSASALDLYRALRRVNPSPYLFLLELDELALIGSSPETLVKVYGPPRVAEPDRRDDRGRRGRRRALARVREGPGRARHARRPGPERPLARLPRGHRARRALPRARALLARDAPRLGGLRRAPRRRRPIRPAARLLPRRHGLGGAQGARDAADLELEGSAAARTRAQSATRCRTGISTRASRSGRRSSSAHERGSSSTPSDTCIAIRTILLADGVAHLQAGAGHRRRLRPAAEHEECLRKLAALEAAIELAEDTA